MTSTDARLLNILEAHGQKFLDSFKPHKAEENKRKRAAADTAEAPPSKLVKFETDRSSSDDYSDSVEEWTGFGSDEQIEDEYEIDSSTEEGMPLEGVLARFQADSACNDSSLILMGCILIATSTSVHKPDVVVFSDFGRKTSEPSSSKKTQGKSFMVRSLQLSRLLSPQPPSKSSKVSKLRDETQEQSTNGTSDPVDDEDDEL